MKSEIRHSRIRALLDKVRRQSYARYLRAVRLDRIRAFSGATVTFDSPVTALIGPNGAGKSTILGACAVVYLSIDPRKVFRKSRFGDDAMDDWSMEYDVIDKSIDPRSTLRSQVRYSGDQWTHSLKLERDVKQFGLNRTVPAVESPLFSHRNVLTDQRKRDDGRFKLDTNESPPPPNVKREAERILGKSLAEFTRLEIRIVKTKSKIARYSSTIVESKEDLGDGRHMVIYRKVEFDNRKRVKRVSRGNQTIYMGSNDGVKYSEFSFGSGESSVLRMVAEIEELEDGSLVLIEEIENGLHPLAVTRMVEYLLDVAERKRIQSIFTTHSDYALSPLPSEAIWACMDGAVEQGSLSIEMLRAVTGRIDRRLAVFVEDTFAATWIEAIVREHLGPRIEEIGVYPVRGDGQAVAVNRSHAKNPSVPFISLCFVDGDSQQTESESERTYRLPGSVPESTVFDSVLRNLGSNIALLTVGCQRPISMQEQVAKVIKDVARANRDPHLLFNQVGEKLGFVPESTVRGAFLAVWIQENPTEATAVAEKIGAALSSKARV